MNVLFCNKYNFEFSGTEAYLFDVMELLEKAGHQTAMFAMQHPSNRGSAFERYFLPNADFRDAQGGFFRKVRLAQRALYSRPARRHLRRMLDVFRPDVAHVRNIYHHLSPSVLWELHKSGTPVIYHLNDYKLICPNYNLISRGTVCERCKGGRFRSVVLERCHGPSLSENLLLAAEAYLHKWLRTYQVCVDRFVAPSTFCREKLIENGWPAERIDVLPHFQAIPPEAEMPLEGDYIVCSGRLSAEKGIDQLLLAMKQLPNVQLKVAGDGRERLRLEALATTWHLSNVSFLGHLDRGTLYQLLRGSRFTVMPSRVYETFGKVILESYAVARPVVASRLGTRPELVEEGRTGLLYEPGSTAELVDKIGFLFARPALSRDMGVCAQESVRAKYSPEAHLTSLLQIYRCAMAA